MCFYSHHQVLPSDYFLAMKNLASSFQGVFCHCFISHLFISYYFPYCYIYFMNRNGGVAAKWGIRSDFSSTIH